jgi:HD-GYP domain-containing protein (c-di-GMP phosphodiesterase class II)
MLHDVGKITIPKGIINKPGKLDPHEWEVIKTHPAAGQRMLDRVGGFMVEVGRIVRAHHERWDGGGYPDGLAGETIPLEARIITCCDSWSAMRTDRPYRRAMSFEAAAGQMIANTGSQFDPAVVEVMLPVVSASEGPEAERHHTGGAPVSASAEELSAAAAQLTVPVTT